MRIHDERERERGRREGGQRGWGGQRKVTEGFYSVERNYPGPEQRTRHRCKREEYSFDNKGRSTQINWTWTHSGSQRKSMKVDPQKSMGMNP